MTTWGDYAITAVRYNDDDIRIEMVQRHTVHPKKLGEAVKKQRSAIVTSIEAGKDYTTAIKNNNGKWSLGNEIHVTEINGGKFIRTDQNNTEEDNLGELPKF